MNGHGYQDEVSLRLKRRIADELPHRPEWIAFARQNIARWSRQNAGAPALLRCYQEWERILELPVDRICAILTDQSDEGQRLRQNSPFAGILSPREVWSIKRGVRDDQRAA